MLYFPRTLLWDGIMDINPTNRKKIRGFCSVALQENIKDIMGGQTDQQSIDGTNKEKLLDVLSESKVNTAF